jgi:hypothetical protein
MKKNLNLVIPSEAAAVGAKPFSVGNYAQDDNVKGRRNIRRPRQRTNWNYFFVVAGFFLPLP